MQCSQMKWGPKFVKMGTLKKMGTKVPKWGPTSHDWVSCYPAAAGQQRHSGKQSSHPPWGFNWWTIVKYFTSVFHECTLKHCAPHHNTTVPLNKHTWRLGSSDNVPGIQGCSNSGHETRMVSIYFQFSNWRTNSFRSAAFFLKWSALCSPLSTSPVVCCTAIVVMATLVSPQPENNGLSGR